ncbi:MAG: A/G-specific adenine glycosylase [Chloroflexota bacterium]
MPPPAALPPAATAAILAWYAQRGRPLAFRSTDDPYAILVSEAMAQQTQAARAAVFWERFMVRFPTVGDLAAASPADVLRAWAGLGYDRRALALWRAARVIVGEHQGRVPDTVAALHALPGVGPYTARAVAALAYGVPVGAVDVNVRRVLGRIVAGSVLALTPAQTQVLADRVVPPDAPGAWTHALMDIGATVCKPRTPDCERCPAAAWCRFADERGSEVAAPPRARAVREPAAPFATTNRWLRGRILDRLRAQPDGAWVALDGPIGVHPRAAVRRAARQLAGDGLIELAPGAGVAVRARLPLA